MKQKHGVHSNKIHVVDDRRIFLSCHLQQIVAYHIYWWMMYNVFDILSSIELWLRKQNAHTTHSIKRTNERTNQICIRLTLQHGYREVRSAYDAVVHACGSEKACGGEVCHFSDCHHLLIKCVSYYVCALCVRESVRKVAAGNKHTYTYNWIIPGAYDCIFYDYYLIAL